MVLSDMKAFFRRLDGASDIELLALRDKIVSVTTLLTDAAILADAKFLLTKVEEEMLARSLK